MAYFGGVNFNYQANLNVQFGALQNQPNPAMFMAQTDFSTQMVVQVLTQMIQVLCQLQSQWAGFMGNGTQFNQPPLANPPSLYQPEPAAAAQASSSYAASSNANLALALAVSAQSEPKSEPSRQESAAAAVAVNVQPEPAPVADASSFSGGGGDGGGGGGDGGDPVILDLNGDNQLDVTGKDGQKINFNLFGNGKNVQTEWLKAGGRDGLLVSDFNGDGKIDSGRELMRTTGVNGEQGKYKDGWDKVSQLFDQNHDGKVSGAELDKLEVWVDKDGDGQSEAGELRSLKDMGISEVDVPDQGPDSTFTMNGKKQLAEDYIFDLET